MGVPFEALLPYGIIITVRAIGQYTPGLQLTDYYRCLALVATVFTTSSALPTTARRRAGTVTSGTE